MEKTWFSKQEIAQYLGLSVPTIERMMKARKIPYYRLSGYPRFEKTQIDNWLEKRAVKTA